MGDSGRTHMDSASKCFIKQDNFVTREIAGETIIVPIRSHVADLDSIYTLNEVGTLIWSLVDGETPLNRIVGMVTEEYDTESEQAEKDVIEFLEALETAGLIHAC